MIRSPKNLGELNSCPNCVRWYSTGADQCDIPISLLDEDGQKFIDDRLGHFHKSGNEFYGHPTQLNYDYKCLFFKSKNPVKKAVKKKSLWSRLFK